MTTAPERTWAPGWTPAPVQLRVFVSLGFLP